MLGDARQLDLSDADVVFMYLEAEIMAELVPKLQASRIVSYLHSIPGIDNRRIETANGPIFIASLGSDYSMDPQETSVANDTSTASSVPVQLCDT